MKCDELKAYGMDDPAIGEEYEMYKVADVDDAIAELKSKLEDAQATAYADSVDAGMRERRIKRAMYKALEIMMRNKAAALIAFHLTARAAKFEKAIDKCRAKAKEYK